MPNKISSIREYLGDDGELTVPVDVYLHRNYPEAMRNSAEAISSVADYPPPQYVVLQESPHHLANREWQQIEDQQDITVLSGYYPMKDSELFSIPIYLVILSFLILIGSICLSTLGV